MNIDAFSPIPDGPRFGVAAPSHGPWGGPPEARWGFSRRLALSAERAGFDSILFDQPAPGDGEEEREVQEALTTAAAAAAVTSRIEVIATVRPASYHPVVLAKLALGIEEITRGRFALRVRDLHAGKEGRGTEWLEVARELTSGQTVNFQGTHFHISDYHLLPSAKYRERPPFYLDGDAEAGIADTRLLDANGDIPQWRGEAAPALGVVGFAAAGRTDAEAEQLLQAPDGLRFPGDLRGDSPWVETPEGVLPAFVGGYDRVAQRLADLHAAGVTTFLFSFFPHLDGQEAFAREVIPRVRALAEARQTA